MELGVIQKGIAENSKSARLSELMAKLDAGRDMSVGSLIDVFSTETVGTAILIFAAPNLVPNLPGTSPILGLPLIFLATQLSLSRQTLWLPKWVRSRQVSSRLIATMVRHLGPLLARLEDVLEPRHQVLASNGFALRVIGLVSLPLVVVLLLPLPFLHMLPGAAMVCYGLGLATRVGLAVLGGHVLALATLAMLAAIALLANGGLMSLLGSGT